MKKIIFSFVLMLFAVLPAMQAQTRSTKPPVKVKLETKLGPFTDSTIINPATAAVNIGLPLMVKDAKNIMYTISSYTFVYRKVGVTEDEATGKVSPTNSMVASVFRTTPLPEIWLKTIQETVKPGEQLIFTDIIVKDNKGGLFYAPSLNILVR